MCLFLRRAIKRSRFALALLLCGEMLTQINSKRNREKDTHTTKTKVWREFLIYSPLKKNSFFSIWFALLRFFGELTEHAVTFSALFHTKSIYLWLRVDPLFIHAIRLTIRDNFSAFRYFVLITRTLVKCSSLVRAKFVWYWANIYFIHIGEMVFYWAEKSSEVFERRPSGAKRWKKIFFNFIESGLSRIILIFQLDICIYRWSSHKRKKKNKTIFNFIKYFLWLK